MSSLARAAGVLLCLGLMAFPSAAAAAAEQVQDGSFEAGYPGWVFEKGAERCASNSPSCGAFAAASGGFYAASKTLTFLPANSGESPVGTITQLVPTPGIPATLSFRLREVSDVGALGTLPLLLEVKYGGEAIREFASAAETFETVSLAIPAPLAGSAPKPLVFEVSCSNFTLMAEACARFDIDDVSLLTPSSPTAQPGVQPDVTAPETALGQIKKVAMVKSAAARAKVRARFTSEAGARFECKLDRRPFSACRSPKILRLKIGKHVLRVRAVDSSGNVDPTPAKATIRVKLAQP